MELRVRASAVSEERIRLFTFGEGEGAGTVAFQSRRSGDVFVVTVPQLPSSLLLFTPNFDAKHASGDFYAVVAGTLEDDSRMQVIEIPAQAVPQTVSRVRSDMRSFATALESWFIDNNSYPLWVPSSNPDAVNHGDPRVGELPSLRHHRATDPSTTSMFFGLTTPIAYLTSHFTDPFAAGPGTTFVYFTDGPGWILVSPGPDRDYDLVPQDVYTSALAQPSLTLLLFAYDPSNGVGSDGDVFRVKQ